MAAESKDHVLSGAHQRNFSFDLTNDTLYWSNAVAVLKKSSPVSSRIPSNTSSTVTFSPVSSRRCSDTMALITLLRDQDPSKSMQYPFGLMWNDPLPFWARPVMSPHDHSPPSTTASPNQRSTRDSTMAWPPPFLSARLNLSQSIL